MNSERLSARLAKVAEYIICYQDSPIRLADIGSDHAYLPCYLGLNHRLQFAIAGEVVEGPFQSAKKEVVERELTNVIEVRKGNGLAVVSHEDSINTISICGMGGVLIRDILQAGNDIIVPETLLVLQPNMASYQLRNWLNNNQFDIIQETVIEDYQRQYEIIVARKTTKEMIPLSEQAQLFGQQNINEKSHAFIQKWTRELRTQTKILEEILKTAGPQHEKAIELQQYIETIKEVLV